MRASRNSTRKCRFDSVKIFDGIFDLNGYLDPVNGLIFDSTFPFHRT